MKTIFNNRELAHIWATQSQDNGKGYGNYYFKDATIYSYGSHFPIACIEGEDVIFTLRSYSNTTAKHISYTHRAITHKNIIYCYDVPVKSMYSDKPYKKQSFITEHENNLNRWKKEIQSLFIELGNKKNRDIQGRINQINTHIERLTRYCDYFGVKIKDKELKSLLSIAAAPDFLEKAREAKANQDKANEVRLRKAEKAYKGYINLWREYREDEIKELPQKEKELVHYYLILGGYTHLRYNKEQNRLETSKGVQIPAPVAKKAFIQLNGCMEGICNSLSIPVMNYTITETTEKYIKAGCHTIPKEDIRYIANLLHW